MADMAADTTNESKVFGLPEWYQPGVFVGSKLLGLTERSVPEGDPSAPEDALNHIRLSLQDKQGKSFTLDFYNYRICEQNFMYSPLVELRVAADAMHIASRGVLYAEIEFDTDCDKRYLLSLTFERVLLQP